MNDNEIYNWLNKDSRLFLKRGYLAEDQTAETPEGTEEAEAGAEDPTEHGAETEAEDPTQT